MKGGLKVLVVDDDPELVTSVVDGLGQAGYEVRAASNGYEAISVAAEFEPDVALLDVLLPDISGITLSAVLKGTVERKRLRVIGISGASVDDLRQASGRGIFDDYLAKPVSLAAIQHALDRQG